MFTSQIEWRKTQLLVEQEEWWFDEISLDSEEISLDLVDIRQIW